MNRHIILPGIGNSGPGHWQSLWQQDRSDMTRFAPSSWDRPDAGDWMSALDAAVSAVPAPPVLIAHSLSCLLVALWAQRATTAIAAAFLVAVPDPQSDAFPAEAASFAEAPWKALPFPSLMVASDDDPYAEPDYTRRRAAAWGSSLVSVGRAGHINGNSGLKDWPHGRDLLTALCAGARCL